MTKEPTGPKIRATPLQDKRDGVKDLKNTPPKPKKKFTRAKENQFKL